MADSNAFRADMRPEFDDTDPFAELTRIMGHDPRQQEAKTADNSDDASAFEIDLEKELLGDLDVEDDAAPLAHDEATPLAHDDDAPSSTFDAVFADAAPAAEDDRFDARSFDREMETALEADTAPADWFQPAADDADDRQAYADDGEAQAYAEPFLAPVDTDAQPEPHAAAPADEAVAADDLSFVDMDFDTPVEQQPDPEPVARSSVFAEEPQETPDDFAASAIEDELNALLVAADDAAGTAPATGFDMPSAPAEPVSDHDAAAFSDDDWMTPAEPVDAAPVEMVAAETEMAEAPESAEPAPATSAYSDFRIAEDRPLDPFAELSALGAGMAASAPAYAAPREEPSAAVPALDDAVEVPDIDTMDVAEAAVPVTDDLDLPDIAYEASAPAVPLDDFDSEFAEAFEELAPARAEQPAAAMPAHEADAADAIPEFDLGIDYGTLAPAEPLDEHFGTEAYYSDAYRPHAAVDDGDAAMAAGMAPDAMGYEPDYEDEVGVAGYEDEAAQPRAARRGLMVAAAVAGVALLGGIGAFALSFGGGESTDQPAIVRADDGPVKVRPENPGGASVPNQDNMVYDRVAGEENADGTAQEQLVSASEEPVDLLARGEETSSGLPGVAMDLPAKSEERIDPAAQAVEEGGNDELVAIAPRRVRTMIVRPDGTIVQREEIAGDAAGEPTSQLLPARVVSTERTAPAGEESAMAPATGEEVAALDDGPTVETPPTAPIYTPRPTAAEAPAAPARQEPRVAAVEPKPARQPATPAVTGGTSEWSMQIASQPTEAGAQASYQDLARRYGSVIGGKGVNIVRADIPGKGTYYRVRIPSASRDEAVRLCSRYKSAGGSCFVSK